MQTLYEQVFSPPEPENEPVYRPLVADAPVALAVQAAPCRVKVRQVAAKPVPVKKSKTSWLPWAGVGSLFFLALLCLGLGLSGANSNAGGPALTVQPVSTVAAPVKKKYVTQKIKDLRVNTWVLADNPETAGIEGIDYSQLDASEYRILQVRMEKPDGGELRIEMIHSLLWMEYAGAYVGEKIPLEYEELGISGRGEVLAILPCPTFTTRPSPKHCLVTSKFTHDAANVLELSIDGLSEPIGVTANHPIWSEDRQEFVQAGSLQIGETLRQADGNYTRVASLLPRDSQEPVYNLEVEGEHVYYVSSSGLLVHNSCATSKNARALRKNMGAAAFNSGDEAHHIVAGTHKMAEDGRKILKRYHIDVNDAVNGVALPNNLHHGKGLHSHLGIKKVVDRLKEAQRLGDTYKEKKTNIKQALSEMAELMKLGNF